MFCFILYTYYIFRFRGKLISYNEFMCNDTVIELIDFGYIYATKMQNVFILPYYFNYDPLVSIY